MPLNKNRESDIPCIIATGKAIELNRRKGMLVVQESTTYPGTTDEDLRKVLEEGSGLQAGADLRLAFSPEREDPGNPDSKVAKIPKVVRGLTPECLKRAIELYNSALNTPVPVSSCRAAEATKLLENIFRGVNIALVNELKIVYDAMGIDIWEVIFGWLCISTQRSCTARAWDLMQQVRSKAASAIAIIAAARGLNGQLHPNQIDCSTAPRGFKILFSLPDFVY